MISNNIPALFFEVCKKHADKVAIEYKIKKSDPYKSISWREYSELVRDFAFGLLSLGIKRKDSIAIISETRYEWAVADFAILSCNGVVVPIYPTLPDAAVKYIINNSESEVVILEDKGQLQKIRGQWDKLPKIKYAIVIDDYGDLPTNDSRILTFKKVLDLGRSIRKKNPALLDEYLNKISLNDPATIIYTSGTTGKPKGVLLMHSNILSVVEVLPSSLPVTSKDKFLSFLPLSHVFERVGSLHYTVSQGIPTTFCSSIDRIGPFLKDSGATVMCVVPRLLEKMYAKIQSNIESLDDSKKKLIKLAIRETIQNDGTPLAKAKAFLLKKTVLKKVRDQISPTLKYFVSGGAPLSRDVALFFGAIGIDVLEGYGLTETSAPATVNTPRWIKPGTVGVSLKNVQIKIAEDGEILIKGPNVFKGYFKNKEATEEAFDGEWFKSGDIGEVDSDGFLKITDRKKDIIITAAGKNVAPQNIENAIKLSRFISNVMVIGDKRKYLSALITIDVDEVKEAFSYSSDEEIYRCEKLRKILKEEIDRATSPFADYEHIIKFTILKNDFSIANGEVTPTLKVKRKYINEKYKEKIDSMYP